MDRAAFFGLQLAHRRIVANKRKSDSALLPAQAVRSAADPARGCPQPPMITDWTSNRATEHPMAITQHHIQATHDLLIAYAYNELAGNLSAKAQLETVCLDLATYCLDGKWDALDANYRAAWAGEIMRRIERIVPDAQTVMHQGKKRTVTQGKVLDAIADGSAQVLRLMFSQFTINRHFQGQYEGQPDWLSGKEIIDVAKTLRQSPGKSNDLRIRAHYHGGQWVALNNRGFALHCLANVVPQRIVFDTALSSDEQERLGRNIADFNLNLRDSIPATRRRKQDWEATIPTSVTAVPETRNSNQVVYTIKAIRMTPNAAADHGNEIVYNSAN
ncbi:hypothetical protein [Piscinibacter sakaiensis]|uniref:hypothetical protein n=1 Tax=Piscinibacter sakaiensis TaxID=1547922 RepID=UPI003AB05957